jgi:hypothetical protein
VQARGGREGDRRFGPYAHAYAIRETLDLLLRVFPVRTCSQGSTTGRERTGRPCLLHHIDRCAAPCTGEVSPTSTASWSTAGGVPRRRDRVRCSRSSSARCGGRGRAQLRGGRPAARPAAAARRALEKQQVVTDRGGLRRDRGPRGRARGRGAGLLRPARPARRPQGLDGRQGRAADHRGAADLLPAAALRRAEDDVPPQVWSRAARRRRGAGGPARRAAARAPGRAAGRPDPAGRFHVPQRGDKRAFLETVEDNAREAFQRTGCKRASDFDARTRALKELQEALDLDEAPLRIECYDISHLGGTEVVGSMVVFEDGLPKQERVPPLQAVGGHQRRLRRDARGPPPRFTRLAEERAAAGRRRGRHAALRLPAQPRHHRRGTSGQLNAALEGIADLPVDDVAFVGLAKRFEELWRPRASGGRWCCRAAARRCTSSSASATRPTGSRSPTSAAADARRSRPRRSTTSRGRSDAPQGAARAVRVGRGDPARERRGPRRGAGHLPYARPAVHDTCTGPSRRRRGDHRRRPSPDRARPEADEARPAAPGPSGSARSTAQRPRILIITGMSGPGRSTASNVVEDLGWFVIDNLPPTLIERVTSSPSRRARR